jgi:hypothetical protein
MKWLAGTIVIVAFISLGFFIGKSCSENATLNEIDKKIKASEKRFDKFQEDIKALGDSLESLAQKRIENKTYYNYEITKIDSIVRLDSTVINAILRTRTDRLYRLPGYISLTIDNNGVKPDSQNISLLMKVLYLR